MGGLLGLDRAELLSNTHWRVLFIKGLHKTVSDQKFLFACEVDSGTI